MVVFILTLAFFFFFFFFERMDIIVFSEDSWGLYGSTYDYFSYRRIFGQLV